MMLFVLNIMIIAGISATAIPVAADTTAIPESIPEAVEYLFELIPNKEIAIIRRTSEEEFATNAVSTLGAYMKDEWKLYSPDSPLGRFFLQNEIFNPDEMAEIILICLWRRLNGMELNIDRIMLERMRYYDELRSGNEP